ncbi:hypothetical protein N0V82_007928 [Gnomoniopsis sp. IMI 355080]|nr:hypothetical protein N0V82_007928 [Gnomoniopsis sp. IMI 355080]
MPSYSSPSGSIHHKSTQRPYTKPHRSYLSTMDNALANDGASTQVPNYKKNKPQHDQDATVPWARGADQTDVTVKKDLRDLRGTGHWTDEVDFQFVRAMGSSNHTNIVQGASSSYVTTLELPYDDQSGTRDDDEARQLPPNAIVDPHQADPVFYDEVHDWVLNTRNNRIVNPPGAHDNARTSHRGRSTRECGSASSSWVLVSATFSDANKDTQGNRLDVPLSSAASYSSWTDVALVSEASVHRSA